MKTKIMHTLSEFCHLRVRSLPDGIVFRETGEQLFPSPNDVVEIEDIWIQQSKRHGGSLWNGRIFNVTNMTPKGIEGCFVEYKLMVARRVSPRLRRRLKFLGLGVSGYFSCADGIVFGLRNPNNTSYERGMWELVPSGSIDDNCQSTNGFLDVEAVLGQELEEEVGISILRAERILPLFLIEDPLNDLLEIVYRIECTLSANEVLSAHATIQSREYTELKVIPHRDISSGVLTLSAPLIPVSCSILRHQGLLG